MIKYVLIKKGERNFATEETKKKGTDNDQYSRVDSVLTVHHSTACRASRVLLLPSRKRSLPNSHYPTLIFLDASRSTKMTRCVCVSLKRVHQAKVLRRIQYI